MSELEIRPATKTDAATIHRFVVELAEFEKARAEVVARVEDIERSLFADGATARALIGSVDGAACGYAVYFFSYSTWLGREGLFLEDLYIAPQARGRGYGRAMLAHLAALAVERGCGRLEWNVLDWNAPAIGFYESLGATALSEWVGYRLTGEALARLARNGAEGSRPAAAPSDRDGR